MKGTCCYDDGNYVKINTLTQAVFNLKQLALRWVTKINDIPFIIELGHLKLILRDKTVIKFW